MKHVANKMNSFRWTHATNEELLCFVLLLCLGSWCGGPIAVPRTEPGSKFAHSVSTTKLTHCNSDTQRKPEICKRLRCSLCTIFFFFERLNL